MLHQPACGSVPRTSKIVRTLLIALLFAVVWTLATASAPSASARTVNAGLLPVGLFGGAGVTIGEPRALTIPNKGNTWTSATGATESGFVVAWAKLKDDYAATAIGAVSPDGSRWMEVVRASANANRSMPHVDLTLPVPEGWRFRLTLEGARGGGLEILESSGAHWFPIGSTGE